MSDPHTAASIEAERKPLSFDAKREEEMRRTTEAEDADRLRRKTEAQEARFQQKERERIRDETALLKLRSVQLEVTAKERQLATRPLPPAPKSSDEIAGMLANRAFDVNNPPPKPIPILQLGEHTICTPGNLSNVQAPAKAGKSAVIGAIMAAMGNGPTGEADTLGFVADNIKGHAVIHFDTEQSPYDHHALVVRSLRRANIAKPPEWFRSYSVADLSIAERNQALDHLVEKAVAAHEGVFAVIIDGVADLCHDPNDSAEAFALVGRLHEMAIKYDCAIITVLHENPGSETGKTRGHLGSQLERKAETNLRLAKSSDGITTIFAERARHAHIPREEGSCFTWSDAARMHVSCGQARELKQQAKRDRANDDAARVFLGKDSLSFTELKAAIMEVLCIADRTAKLRIRNWYETGILTKDESGHYFLP